MLLFETPGLSVGWLGGYLERSTASWVQWLTDHPRSALCDVTVTEINRLLRENLDFWIGSSEPYDEDRIAHLLRRYESAAGRLERGLRARARIGTAEAWLRIGRSEEARRLYREILLEEPDHPRARAALQEMSGTGATDPGA